MSKVNYIDVSPYNGEDDVLRLKLKITNDIVDWWVIMEGDLSHTSIKKELMFDYDNFEEYRHKIVYLPLRDFPKPEGTAKNRKDYYDNEMYNRY